MKKNILLATALAITALAGCTDDSFVGDQKLVEANGNGAISFNSGSKAITRADGAEAAKLLKTTGLSIAEISAAVGFQTQSKFTQAFKETYHVLPRDYRG